MENKKLHTGKQELRTLAMSDTEKSRILLEVLHSSPADVQMVRSPRAVSSFVSMVGTVIVRVARGVWIRGRQ
jgi:hypothetical protein